MRVLVTGGAGFIGSHVVDLLMAEGHEVVVLDDLSHGRIGNLGAHIGNPRFKFVRGDVRDRGTVEGCLEKADWVVHEAAMISVQRSIENPELARSINVGGTRVLLEASADAGVERFLLASSCSVYGRQEKLPIPEDARPDPLSPYAESKLEAEELCMRFHREARLQTTCLRYFNVYGPRQAADEYAAVMVRFAERLRAGLPPQIYGDGEQTRDFVFVSDVARATLLALKAEEAAGEIVNVGTGKETSVNELCRIFLEVSGSRVEPVYLPPLEGEVRRSCADVRKAERILKFVPRTDLRKGVEELWKIWRGG